MPDSQDPFDDGFGPDVLNRGSGKVMGSGGSGGGDIDPSYEDALRILGRAHEIPSPFEQRALTMDNPEAADLARRLTTLRQAAGAGPGWFSLTTLGRESDTPSVSRVVRDFIAALQESPPDVPTLNVLYRAIAAASGEIRSALESVCEHEGVRSILADDGP